MRLGTTCCFLGGCATAATGAVSKYPPPLFFFNTEIISSKSLVLVHILLEAGLVGLILRIDAVKEISDSQNWIQRVPEGQLKQPDE